MEGNLQEHMQELQRMRIASVLTKKKLTLESYIRKKAKEVSATLWLKMKEVMEALNETCSNLYSLQMFPVYISVCHSMRFFDL